MCKAKISTAVVFVVLFMVGCAARQPLPPPSHPPLPPPEPVYKTIKTHHRPQDPQGQICVVQCQNSKGNCNMLCRMEYGSCVRDAKDQARFLYEDAKERYRKQEIVYERKYGEPLDPIQAPSLADFLNTASCNKDCGCEEEYDSCFEACGGTITRMTQCEEHCDQVERQETMADPGLIQPSLGLYQVSVAAPLRRQPATDAEVVTVLAPGTKVQVVRTVGEYLEVHSTKGNAPGYVLQEHTTFLDGQ